MTSVTGTASEQFLADLAQIEAQTERARRVVSSGLKIERPSDSPEDLGDILVLQAGLARNSQIQSNLNRVKTEVDTGESVLESGVRLVERALVLAGQAAGGLRSAQDRQNILTEVQGLQEQLVGLSCTSVEGRFIFSGDQDGTPPYQLDLSAPGGVSQLVNASATRTIEDSNGSRFAVGQTAQQIFDNPSSSVFAAINALRLGLEANSDSDISAAIGALEQARDHLGSALSFYGGVQQRVSDAISLATSVQTNQTKSLSQYRDADLPSAASQLAQLQIQRDAAMTAEAGMPRKSLLDFLA
jgi:flagellar hook-associated protein 3 FlgL